MVKKFFCFKNDRTNVNENNISLNNAIVGISKANYQVKISIQNIRPD